MPEMLVCGICGKQVERTEEAEQSWEPDVWTLYPDGSEKEVGPVCGDHGHELTYEESSGSMLYRAKPES